MNESVEENDMPLTREDIEDSGIDIAITDIFKKPVTNLVLETSEGEIKRETIIGDNQGTADSISVNGDFTVEKLTSDEAIFLELEFLDDGDKYYIELDEDTIWNIYQHFGTIKKEDLINTRSVVDYVNDDTIVINRSQYKKLSKNKPTSPDSDELDIDITLEDTNQPVQNYENIVHKAALSQNTPFSVIVQEVHSETDPATVIVRHGELLYTFEYPCESDMQDCNAMFKRLVNEIGNGEPAALHGTTLQIKHKDSLGQEQTVYGELEGDTYVLTRPLTNNRSVFNKVSSLLSKGKIMYRGNSEEER